MSASVSRQRRLQEREIAKILTILLRSLPSAQVVE
jgi:hypothetical protein